MEEELITGLITHQLGLLSKEKMRLQEKMRDLQRSFKDCQEEICHFEKLLLDRSQTVKNGGERRWTLVAAGAAPEERPPEIQALQKDLLERLVVQRKLSEDSHILQDRMHNLAEQLEARAEMLVEEEMELEELLLEMEAQEEEEVKEKQEKEKRSFWRF